MRKKIMVNQYPNGRSNRMLRYVLRYHVLWNIVAVVDIVVDYDYADIAIGESCSCDLLGLYDMVGGENHACLF